MTFLELLIIMDALIAGLYFGMFQAAMPLAGFLIGSVFARIIDKWDHWVAFTLLAIIGIKMIIESKKKGSCQVLEDNSHLGIISF